MIFQTHNVLLEGREAEEEEDMTKKLNNKEIRDNFLASMVFFSWFGVHIFHW